MSRWKRLLSALSIGLGLTVVSGVAQAGADEGVTLKYDDGTMEGKRSSTGGGHAVLFKRPDQGEWYLDRVELFGARYGYPKAPDEDFFIYVTDPSMDRLAAATKPYGTFERGEEKWVRIDLPPVRVPESFYVCFVFNPMQTKGVYVGIDKSGTESHSKDAVPGSHISDVDGGGQWMIRAHLTRQAQGPAQELLSKEQREKKRQEESAAREARLLKGAKATLLKYDSGTMDKYFSYGGPTAQTVAFDAPPDTPFVFRVSFYGSQYGGQHDAQAVCGDIYILDANCRVISRTSFPYSLLTYQKAWIEVPILPTKVSGKFYVALHAHSEQYKGIYVGYDEHIQESHSSLGSVSREQFKLNPLRDNKKFEWMIRVGLAERPVYYEAAEVR